MTVRRLAAILSIDVVGFSSMMEGDAAGTVTALNTLFREAVKPTVEENGGRIFKLLGDGALIEFSSAHGAIVSAAAIQQGLAGTANPSPARKNAAIALRMGIHAGDVVGEGQDNFGDAVNIASRLQAEAGTGDVLLSKTVADLAGGDLPFQLRREGVRKLKNISNPVEVLSVDLTANKRAPSRAETSSSLQVRFCKSADNHSLAWAASGDGPPIVKAPSWISHVELVWRDPGMLHLFESISSYRRLVYFDARGNGLSDWDIPEITFDLAVSDLKRVFDAAGVDRGALLGISQGGAIAAAFAARFPERVSAIVMLGSYPLGRGKRNAEKDRARAQAMQAMMAAGWDEEHPSLRDLLAETIVPAASAEEKIQFAEDMRSMISPETLARYRAMLDDLDVRDHLPKVQAPCLVLHSRGDRMQPIDQGRLMASGIPNATFVALDSNNHNVTENDPAWPIAERSIRSFLEANQ